jgi:uncharacterized protein
MSRIVRWCLSVAFVGALATVFVASQALALDIPAKPLDIPIVDQTNTLSAEQKAQLATQIADERTKSGNQIAIVIVPTLENEALEDYSLQIARTWGIGTGENNNGVLLFIAKDDRKLRIEVGTGLEGALTDVQAGRIIRNDISPRFRQGQYYEGIQVGLTSIIAAIHGEYTASAIALSWLGSILGRTKSWWAGGVLGGVSGGVAGLLSGSLLIGLIGIGALGIFGLIFDKIVSANYRAHAGGNVRPSWWAGGGFLGGGGPRGGGGFGGFGGGGFGGGGSSGSW